MGQSNAKLSAVPMGAREAGRSRPAAGAWTAGREILWELGAGCSLRRTMEGGHFCENEMRERKELGCWEEGLWGSKRSQWPC